jgi:hypothetical protein
MRNIILAACVATLLLTGCARRYALTLNNGTRVTAFGKPHLDPGGNSYVYKDASGQLNYIPAGRVRDISPASQSASFYNPSSSK